MEKELPRFLCGATLVDLGGLLCLVWEGKAGRRAKVVVEIYCTGIEISRTVDGRLRGKVLWCEEAVPMSSAITDCVGVEL